MSETAREPESRRGAIAWMAGHSVAANLIMLACLVGGLISLLRIKQEVFPDADVKMVQVRVAYPGAGPEEVESGIVLAVEEAVRAIEGVKEISSTVAEGSGTTTIELLIGADEQEVAREVQSEIDRITTFPEDAEEPQITVTAQRREVIEVVLFGDVPLTSLHRLAEDVRDHFLQDPGISQVTIEGLPPLEIAIEVPQENLRRYGVTLDEIAERLRAAALDVPGGGVKTDAGEILVRLKERRDHGREFAKVPVITTPEGTQLRLEDIATIRDGFADAERLTLLNGKPAVTLEVFRIGDETPIGVAEAARARVESFRPRLPDGVEIRVMNDRSDYYRQRVELLLKNGAMGLALVLVLLGIFLEARVAFWVMMGIPISFVGAFLFLPMLGVTINMISLFAFIIALGIVVDDAIVVGENIHHYRGEGMSPLDASIRGAREVAMPVTFAILTNIVCFLPIALAPGRTGNIFMFIPIVVSVTFLISLVEGLFVLPAHLAHGGRKKRRPLTQWLHDRQRRFRERFKSWVRTRYLPFLAFSVRHRYVTIAASFALLAVCLAWPLSGRMGFSLFPTIESDYAQASVVMPYGTPLAATRRVIDELLEGADRVMAEIDRPELFDAVVADIGQGGTHTARVRLMLGAPELRREIMSTEEITNRWRDAVGEIAGVEGLRFQADAGGPGGGGADLTLEVSHGDIETLEAASRDAAEALATYPSVSDVDDGYQLGKRQLELTVKPEGRSAGLTSREVARQVRSALHGAEVLRQQRARNEIKVMVRLAEVERTSQQSIDELMIRTPAGTHVPLREIATISSGRAFTTINRREGRRVVQVTGSVTPRGRAGEVIDDLRVEVLPGLRQRYPGLQASFEGRRAEMAESLASLRTTFTLAMLAVYALLAIPFRSYVQPLIVMVGIPFGVVGAILGHLVMGFGLSLPSLFGIIALSGVVVNDSLVLVDFANRRRREDGASPLDAILAAGVQRFRPILLTTLTTFGGLAPMIFETSRQARFLIPMALSLGFGILFATFITLLLVPSLYVLIEDVRFAWRRSLRFLFPPAPAKAVEAGD